jgi:hypothetical protein
MVASLEARPGVELSCARHVAPTDAGRLLLE